MINLEHIGNISNIAKLHINEAEKEAFKEYMKNVIEYVEILNEVNIDNQILLDEMGSEAAILRNDVVEASYERENLLKNAPKTEDVYFLVPNIMI